MNTTELPTFTAKKASSLSTDNITKLWQKIEKNELRNKKAQVKIDALFAEYEKCVMPQDIKVANLMEAWITHLLSFFGSKELKKNAKQQLLNLIEEGLDDLYSMRYCCDMEKFNALTSEYESYHSTFYKKEKENALEQACDQFEAVVRSEFSQELEIPREELKRLLQTGDFSQLEAFIFSLQKAQFPEMFETNSSEHSAQEGEWRDFEFSYYQNEEDDSPNIREMFRGTQLNKMYKRIANVIHPDKETDPMKKEEKHNLMQVLAVAKQSNDVMTLLRMHSQYVPDADYTLDDETLMRMEHLLMMRVRELNREHRDLFNLQGFKSHVWKEISAPSKKKVQENLQQQLFVAQNIAAEIEQRIMKTKNATKLKRYMKYSYNDSAIEHLMKI